MTTWEYLTTPLLIHNTAAILNNWGKQGCYFSANESMTMYAVNQNDVYTVPTISTGFNAIGWSASARR